MRFLLFFNIFLSFFLKDSRGFSPAASTRNSFVIIVFFSLEYFNCQLNH